MIDHIAERIKKMRENIGSLGGVDEEELLVDLDWLADEIHGLECALNEAEGERDHLDCVVGKIQEELEALQEEDKQRKEDEFRNILIAAAQGPSAPGHGDPVGPVWAQEDDGQP